METAPGSAPKIELFEGNEWELPTDVGLIDGAADEFENRLKAAGWGDTEISGLGLAFREALANAIKHGNGFKENKKVKIVLNINNHTGELSVTVSDEGAGFKPENVPNPTEDEGLTRVSGRGIFLMREYFDEVKYTDDGRTAEMKEKRKSLGREAEK